MASPSHDTFTELFYHRFGDEANDPAPIQVSPNTTIDVLRNEILQSHERDTNTRLINVRLYQIDVALNDLSKLEAPSKDFTSLKRMLCVKDYWPDLESLDRNRVRVLVTGDIAPVSPVGNESPHVPAAEDVPDDLITSLKKSRTHFRQSLGQSSASTAANPGNFARQQRGKQYILNGRPREHSGPPIVLYHPVFGNFLSNLQSSEPLPPSFYYAVLEYFGTSQNTYDNETGSNSRGSNSRGTYRGERTRKALEAFLGRLWVISEPGAIPDGVSIGASNNPLLFIEMKNEIGTGGSDPSIQVAQSYIRCWIESKLLDRCRCPSILIAIAGPWMCILGAVFLNRPVIQPLTDYLWIGINPSKPRDVGFVARVFHSVLEARRELDAYYLELNSQTNTLSSDDISALFFPYPTHFIGDEGGHVTFTYKDILNLTSLESNSHLKRSKSPFVPDKLVFRGELHTTRPPTPIVVKFVQSYNAEAHKLLAQNGLAPKLLYDGSGRVIHPLGPDYRMIVMEYVNGVDLGRYPGSNLPLCVSQDIDRALSLLHNGGFVFGDLRPPNVMLVKNEDGAFTGAKLIDFDWCGKHQEGRYPFDMNERIPWASGVGPMALLDKGHDMEMRESLHV